MLFASQGKIVLVALQTSAQGKLDLLTVSQARETQICKCGRFFPHHDKLPRENLSSRA